MATERSTASPAPKWASLLKQGIARHKHDPTAKFCQLGTAAVGGGASVRTWVFRGFYEDSGALKFITDRRSEKIPEIAADPAGEVCFYLAKTREQFRIKGRLQVVDVNESDETLAKARRHQWTQISPSSQGPFASPARPGSIKQSEGESSPSADSGDAGSGSDKDSSEREGRSKRERSTRQRGRSSSDAEDKEASGRPVADDFCLVLLWPTFVDHLMLKDGQSRKLHKIDGDRDGGGALLADTSGTAGAEGGRPPEAATWVTLDVVP